MRMFLCYDVSMRTTLTLDNDLAATLRAKARRSGRPFKDIVNRTLRLGLEAELVPPPPREYRLEPASLGPPAANVDLDHALRLADTLEQTAIGRKLELRK